MIGIPAIVVNGHWQPGIGDPSIWGWLITLGYVTATVLGFWAAAASDPALAIGERRLWLAISLVLCVLGINKQLDLQTWLWLVGRQMAHDQGWYEYKNLVRPIIAFVLVVGGLTAVVRFGGGAGSGLRRRPWALTGLAVLLLFVTLRALSFHSLDDVFGHAFAGTSIYSLLEMTGIVLIGISALMAGPLRNRDESRCEWNGNATEKPRDRSSGMEGPKD